MVTRDDGIAVIGAGLAGAACARALSRAGFSVTVFDRADVCASGASGNPVGILHPLYSRDHNLASRWTELGCATTLRWLDQLAPLATSLGLDTLAGRCGVLQMDAQAQRLVAWWPWAAWVRPARFVRACLEDAVRHGARLALGRDVQAVSGDGVLHFADGSDATFAAVVLCNAAGIEPLAPRHGLMLNSIRGTITSFQVNAALSLPCVVCASGYATPVIDGEMVVGASFERLDSAGNDTVVAAGASVGSNAQDAGAARGVQAADEPDDMSNLDRLRIISEPLWQAAASAPSHSRTAVRSAALDRMPHVGRLIDPDTPLLSRMSRIAHMPRSPRLWTLGAMGSRGLAHAALGAEVLTALMREQPLPVPDRLLASVDPTRFVLRRHQRGK
jgi:tRNA 5-methylaminomethyl-2-thiouridine biosynthesis bifunctional protein